MSNPRSDAAISDISEWLLAVELATGGASSDEEPAASRVSGKLRTIVSSLVGVAGYKSILMRALNLTMRDTDAFRDASVTSDGFLKDLNSKDPQASELLIFHLVDLLVVLTGVDFTLQLLQEAWPGLPEFNISELRRKWA
jgi:hypothetical protein